MPHRPHPAPHPARTPGSLIVWIIPLRTQIAIAWGFPHGCLWMYSLKSSGTTPVPLRRLLYPCSGTARGTAQQEVQRLKRRWGGLQASRARGRTGMGPCSAPLPGLCASPCRACSDTPAWKTQALLPGLVRTDTVKRGRKQNKTHYTLTHFNISIYLK